jgi:hypothetical protein
MKLEKCVVSYEDWQMQCCGDPFKIGDSIKWPVYKWVKTDNQGTDDSLTGVDYIYEAHDTRLPSEMLSLMGVVVDIKADYYRTEMLLHPRIKNGQRPVLTYVYEKSYDISVADGRDKDIDGLEFGSYRITLRDCELSSETK